MMLVSSKFLLAKKRKSPTRRLFPKKEKILRGLTEPLTYQEGSNDKV
jgi:hypothetical protein